MPKTFQDKLVHRWFWETEEYQDEAKDIFNSISNEDVLIDSASEGPIEESWTNRVLKWNKRALKSLTLL